MERKSRELQSWQKIGVVDLNELDYTWCGFNSEACREYESEEATEHAERLTAFCETICN